MVHEFLCTWIAGSTLLCRYTTLTYPFPPLLCAGRSVRVPPGQGDGAGLRGGLATPLPWGRCSASTSAGRVPRQLRRPIRVRPLYLLHGHGVFLPESECRVSDPVVMAGGPHALSRHTSIHRLSISFVRVRLSCMRQRGEPERADRGGDVTGQRVRRLHARLPAGGAKHDRS
jgi:hypothetical protein